MAGSASVLEDHSLLSRLDRTLNFTERQLAIVCGLATLSLMLLATVSVAGRMFFNAPLPGYIDWIEQIMPVIAFMAISYTQRDGGHIRMDILVGRLRGRVLWLFELVTTIAIFILVIALIYGSWAHFERGFDFARPMWSNDSSIDISLPLWPAKLLAPVAFSVLALRLVLQIYAYGKAFFLNISEPIAIPLVQSAAEQAAEEAKHVSGSQT